MQVHIKQVADNGPVYLWYLFHYHSTASQVVIITLSKIAWVDQKLVALKGNIDKQTPYVNLLLTLVLEAGVSNAQAFEKTYKV